MRNLLLTSTGFTNKRFEKIFLETIGKPANEIRVIFVPTAANDDESKAVVPFCKQDLTDAGVLESNIITYDCDHEMNDSEISTYDAIYFSGGSSQYLIQRVNESGFAKTLLKAVNNGLFYIGVSAGSMIASTAVNNNLGIIPNPIKPHCTSEVTPNGSIPNPGEKINISDEQAVWIHEDVLEIIS